ncbi:MAG: ExbD/TolR family protein [Opitutales bacterium]
MSLVPARRHKTTVNLVPLIDVLTVLLFFFMVTMQFRNVSTLNITMPEIETAGQNRLEEPIFIAVDAEGMLFLNNKEVTRDQLRGAMQVAGETDQPPTVQLIADEDAGFKYVTEVMDICRSEGLSKIRIQSR